MTAGGGGVLTRKPAAKTSGESEKRQPAWRNGVDENNENSISEKRSSVKAK